jgi:TatA/E family protein of Tat protein translocase
MSHIAGMDMVCASLAFIDGLGGPEMILIFVLVLVLFGGNKLPEFARGMGKSIREFKKAAAGVEEEFKRALEEDERKKNVPAIMPPAAAETTAPTVAPDYEDHTYHDAGPMAESESTSTPAAETPASPATPPADAPAVETDITKSAAVAPAANVVPGATVAPTPAPAVTETPPAPPPPSPLPDAKPGPA